MWATGHWNFTKAMPSFKKFKKTPKWRMTLINYKGKNHLMCFLLTETLKKILKESKSKCDDILITKELELRGETDVSSL
jgi:hypothetical protein